MYMPFRCNYCGGYFCAEHRLPEFHDCTGLHRGLGAVNIGRGSQYRPSDSFNRRQRRSSGYSSLFRFSEREVRDLTVSLLLIASLTLTFQNLRWFILRSPLIVVGAVGIFAAAFLFHELAHKFSAQRLGYWAEFRLNTTGVLITLMSLFLPLKIVAPGAVVIVGLMYGNDYGKISIVGPLTNIAQAAMYLAIYLISTNPLLDALASAGITINSSLALFNLIPFGIFDGEKVYRWNWRIWLATVVVAGLLFLYPGL
jgi:Zn-dependent protease